MHIAPFAVEQWMNAHETRCALNLAETCIESLTLGELLDLAGVRDALLADLRPIKLTYGEIEGSERLRTAIAALYARQSWRDVLITHGASGANALVYQALVGAGDRVVTVVPTYQQHEAIPESLGADVQRLRLRADDGYRLDLDALRALVTPGTRLIALTNPNNPTGALLDAEALTTIVAMADAVGAYVLCDEVYRDATHDDEAPVPSIADLYARGISTGSMSKAYSLAGVRLGWICGPPAVLRAAEVHRDYNTISVGRIDDLLAAIALESRDAILARNRHIVRTNLAVLEAWVAAEPLISWVKPRAGTIALLAYDLDMSSEAFCLRLLEETGVLFTPGSAFGVEGTVRIGYANNPTVLADGLREVSGFLRRLEPPA
ncbi:aminotransferase [Luteitalea sp. TBR-22]|uniref:aminotransferase n=1 Tax=Luteitalea sp. TBR-22 TaxID=2802971 RepID=UPI001AFA6179|nr:aminotransferase [Luteitalea sp. TBR-22]BCS31703.1 aminotransferase [Luteitalea sp. TBR-22]